MKHVGSALLLVMIGVSLPPSLLARQFERAVYYNVGTHDLPYYVVSGQLTNSGNFDLAVADYLNSQVSILLGNGDGTFQKPKRFTVPNPIGLAIGDFNGDQKEDLAVVSSGGTGSGSLCMYLGQGDGTFHLSACYTAGIEPILVATADFNGDGNLDVAVADKAGYKNAGSVTVFFGTGKGTLKNPATYKVTGAPYGIAAGDLNGDRHPDLVVTDVSGGNAIVLLNDGTGKFQKPVVYSVGGGEAVDVKIADLRHDGRNDLAVVNASINEIAILLNNGDGTFAPAKFYISGFSWGTGTDAVVIADFNLDGKLDLATANQNGNSALLYGRGDGTFKAAVPIHDEIKFDGAISLTVGDFNNDKAPDLAFAMYFKNKIAVMINTR
ncbi:MAG TPA: VCBS repeat-containing protein [Terriglobales bacterium]|nr:VCBS repeat-containing protein [Terriglobales bacterium]